MGVLGVIVVMFAGCSTAAESAWTPQIRSSYLEGVGDGCLQNGGGEIACRCLVDRIDQRLDEAGHIEDLGQVIADIVPEEVAYNIGVACAREADDSASPTTEPPSRSSEPPPTASGLDVEVANMASAERRQFCRDVTHTPSKVLDKIKRWTGEDGYSAIEQAYAACTDWGL